MAIKHELPEPYHRFETHGPGPYGELPQIPPIVGGGGSPTVRAGKRAVQKWWKEVQRNSGHYKCYAMFLVLPSDKEAIHYMAEYGQELDSISGDNCLVIALSSKGYRVPQFSEKSWKKTIKEHSNEGYSVKVAQLFDLPLTEFPCLLIFRDISTPDRATIILKGLTADEMAGKMRAIFTRVQKAIRAGKDPLAALRSFQRTEYMKGAGRRIVTSFGNLIEKSYEDAMRVFFETTLKKPGTP